MHLWEETRPSTNPVYVQQKRGNNKSKKYIHNYNSQIKIAEQISHCLKTYSSLSKEMYLLLPLNISTPYKYFIPSGII